MALCVSAVEEEQIEILLPDGRKIIVIVLPPPGRRLNNSRISFVLPKDLEVQRRPRKSKEQNEKDLKHIEKMRGIESGKIKIPDGQY